MELHDRFRPHSENAAELPEPPRCGSEDLPPPNVFDRVVETFKKDIDRTLLIENLKLTPAQRAEKLESFVEMLMELREATKSWRT